MCAYLCVCVRAYLCVCVCECAYLCVCVCVVSLPQAHTVSTPSSHSLHFTCMPPPCLCTRAASCPACARTFAVHESAREREQHVNACLDSFGLGTTNTTHTNTNTNTTTGTSTDHAPAARAALDKGVGNEGPFGPRGAVDSDLIQCHICGKMMDHMSGVFRQRHINRCLDSLEANVGLLVFVRFACVCVCVSVCVCLCVYVCVCVQRRKGGVHSRMLPHHSAPAVH